MEIQIAACYTNFLIIFGHDTHLSSVFPSSVLAQWLHGILNWFCVISGMS